MLGRPADLSAPPCVPLQFVCNWTLCQCDRMPPQVLLLFHDALDGDATVSFVC